MFGYDRYQVDKGKQKLLTNRLSSSLVKNFDYIIIIPLTVSFLMRTCGNTSPRRSFFYFFCKKVLTNCYFYGKIGGATMVDARCFSVLSSFFHFFRSKFQILFIFANSRKVFCIYSPIIGATLVIMRRFSEKSSKKLKKIAQFSNKIFVQFSQKYTASALHRVEVLNFTALKSRCPPANLPIWARFLVVWSPIWRRLLVVWPYMRPPHSCLILSYGGSR